MAFQHLDSFVKAAYQVVQTMVTPVIQSGRPFFNENPLQKYEVSVLVGVLGDVQGQVICGMSEATACSITGRMLGYEVSKMDEMSKSAICELKNIIIGNASTNLSLIGLRCNITPPILLSGGAVPDFLKHIQTALAVPLDTGCGPIEMNLALRLDDKNE